MQAKPSSPLPEWLAERLDLAAARVNDPEPLPVEGPLHLGIDLGTSDVVSIVLDAGRRPVAVCLEWADVVRDGVVYDFHGAVSIVRHQLSLLESKLGRSFTQASTSFPPGTDPRISVNVLEAAGLAVTALVDEPSAVARLLELDRAAVVDIGGGTTGIAVLRDGDVIYSGDEATGGHHVSLTLAGSRRISLEAAEALKLTDGAAAWPTVRPVFEKMADIVRSHLSGHAVDAIYLAGGSCALPGVGELFTREFPGIRVTVPNHPIFFTPFAIAAAAC
ncbi:MAG: ethanolamine utilization protein EutJ [Candidatus Accumulibacter sp.]|jgi:ethanolamine utilization protein EutJ|nr:ethanolamine utilization protein EutJ [Accumulibacter sp.]